MRVSDPDSPHFSQHWGADAVAKHFAPAVETLELVISWLNFEGIRNESIFASADNGWVSFRAPILRAQALLEAEFHSYTSAHSKRTIIVCEDYSLPAHT